MSKLDPAPKHQRPKYGWEELNQILQANFSSHDLDVNTLKLEIDLDGYSLNKEEVIDEARNKGYKATDGGNNLVIFELDN